VKLLIKNPARFGSLVQQARFSSLVQQARFGSLVQPARFGSLVQQARFGSLVQQARFGRLVHGMLCSVLSKKTNVTYCCKHFHASLHLFIVYRNAQGILYVETVLVLDISFTLW